VLLIRHLHTDIYFTTFFFTSLLYNLKHHKILSQHLYIMLQYHNLFNFEQGNTNTQ